MAQPIILAVPKGRLLEEALPLLVRAGIEPEAAFADGDSRALRFGTNRPDISLIRVRALFADSSDTLAERVGAVTRALRDVQLLSCDSGTDSAGGQAILTLPADTLARAALLRALVEAGLPVISFADERENLHESYLRTMKSTPPGVAQERTS